jgi:hypothetical protein
MALGFVTTLRNSVLDQITVAVGASGFLDYYNGTKPATGGTITTLLAHLPCNATFAPASSAGVLTLNAITAATASATGTATWARFTTSGGVGKIDMTVGLSASDLNMSSVSFVSGGNVAVSSFTITDGNP